MAKEKAEIVRMADGLLDALEDQSVSFDILLAKAYRLAEAIDRTEQIYELHGYDSSTPIGEKYARLARRWDGFSDKGYFREAANTAGSAGP
jgi:hypothetical protein